MTESDAPAAPASRGGGAAPFPRRPGATLAEAALVLGTCAGVFLVVWAWRVWRIYATHGSAAPAIAFTNGRTLMTLVVEAVLAAVFLPWLRSRGWRPAEVAGSPRLTDIPRGFGLWLGAIAAVWLCSLTMYVIDTWASVPIVRPTAFTGALSPVVVVVVALLNPIFEEFLWLGYAVPTIASVRGMRWAIVASVAVRVAVHLYQGPYVFVGILPIALVFTWYYAERRRLWPVIVAHVIADGIGLAYIARGGAA